MPDGLAAYPPLRSAQDEAAALVLDHAFRWSPLPDLPEASAGPDELVALDSAARLAPGVLRDLAAIYGVPHWDLRSYEDFILRRAFAAWKPGTRVQRDLRTLRVVSPMCPLAAQIRWDTRLCTRCRLLFEVLARVATRERLEGVHFRAVMSEGAPRCRVEVVVAPAPPSTEARSGLPPAGERGC